MASLGSALAFGLGGDAVPKLRFDEVPGADLTLVRNDENGKYDLQWSTSGDPVFGDDQSHAILSRIFSHKGKYWADATGDRGSFVYTLKEIRRTAPSKLQAFISDALQPLLDAGKIRLPAVGELVSVSRDRFNLNRLIVTINYSTPSGQQIPLRLPIGY